MPIPQPAQAQQQQPNQASQATQAALQSSQGAPQPQQPEQEGQPSSDPGNQGDQDNFDSNILQNLEQHLNSINPAQKQFLAESLQHYANIVIPVLGIVCGQEVFQYFTQLYQQHFAKGMAQQQPANPANQQAPNSAPAPQGQAPNSGVTPQVQNFGGQQPQQAQAQAAPQQP